MTKQKSLFAFEKTKDQIKKYSYSKIDLFLQCPLRYKLHYIEGRPHKKQNLYYLNVGRNVHETLRIFFSSELEGRSINVLFDLLEAHWDFRKFENELESEEWLTETKKMLSNFFTNEELNNRPFLLEASFKVPFNNSLITGKIDRVDKLHHDGYEIIDYKIGEKNINLTVEEIKKDLQWIFYWIGLKKQFHIRPLMVSFYYLASGKRFTFSPTKDEVENGIIELNSLIKKINNTNNFPPKSNRECMSCLFRSSCPI